MAHTLAPDPVSSVPAPATSAGKRLIQAAALAAALVPLGSVPAESATIDVFCTSNVQGSGFCQGSGASFASGEGSQAATWGFFTNSNFDDEDLIYTLTIEGSPLTDFTLFVEDIVTLVGPVFDLAGYLCIPTFDETRCGGFDVTADGPVSWADLYTMTILWFPNSNPLSSALLNQNNTEIAKSEDGISFTAFLIDKQFFPEPTPGEDPGISGRGDGFSQHFAVTNASIPEPSSLLLMGLGAAAVLTQARRRRRLP